MYVCGIFQVGSEHIICWGLQGTVRDVHLYHKQKFTYRSEVNVRMYVCVCMCVFITTQMLQHRRGEPE